MELITNDQLLTVFQIIIALSVLRVWTMNFNKPSRWRGGGAKNMKEEFIAYGLPSWIMYLVGSLKVAFSIGLLAGLWIPEVVVFSASGIAIMLSLIHISEPTRPRLISYAVFCLKKKGG